MWSQTRVRLLASWSWRSRTGCGFKIYQTGSDAESKKTESAHLCSAVHDTSGV